jgi:hypothetical protein
MSSETGPDRSTPSIQASAELMLMPGFRAPCCFKSLSLRFPKFFPLAMLTDSQLCVDNGVASISDSAKINQESKNAGKKNLHFRISPIGWAG